MQRGSKCGKKGNESNKYEIYEIVPRIWPPVMTEDRSKKKNIWTVRHTVHKTRNINTPFVIPVNGTPFHLVISVTIYIIQPIYRRGLHIRGDTNPERAQYIVYKKIDIIIQCSVRDGFRDFTKFDIDIPVCNSIFDRKLISIYRSTLP